MWEFNFQVDRDSTGPLFMQVATSIAQDIVRGRLRPGDRLPGTRTLAVKLGVNRVTVAAAYDELTAEGWVVTHPARGTFVAQKQPTPSRGPEMRASSRDHEIDEPAYVVPSSLAPTQWLPPSRGLLAFRSSYPDTRLVRVDPLLRAYRRVLRRSDGRLLGYGEPQGLARLRRAIARMLRETRALAVSAEHVLVTRGSQMAIALTSRAFIRQGDTVAVEEPGYRYAWDAFRHAGATLAAVAVDESGIDIASVLQIAKRTSLRAVYVTPHHQLPTTVTLRAERRAALLEAAHSHGFVIIEDDYDHEFHFDGRPVAPLASVDPSVVVYIDTFSKIFAPGIRLGFVVAPTGVVQQLTAYRQAIDMQGDPAMEAAIAELIEEEEIQRHVRRAKRIYERRRDVLADALSRSLGGALSFSVPPGGIGLWTRVDQDIDVDKWAAASHRRGAAFLTGCAFTIDSERIPFARFGFACLNEEELKQAVGRLSAALPEARRARARSSA